MKRTRRSDAGDKVCVKTGLNKPDFLLSFSSCLIHFAVDNLQKDVKASPQVNGKDTELSKGKRLLYEELLLENL